MENSHLMILALTDGKAGHETQTKGILTLLNNGNQYEVQWLKIYKVSKLTKHILKAFLPPEMGIRFLSGYCSITSFTVRLCSPCFSRW